ncbi:MAG: lysophospholipid acyltransferase family protein [Campylobacterota bacterium]
MSKIIYYIFLGFVSIQRKLPKKIRRAFFKIVAYLAYKFAFKTNRIIQANLKLVFDNKLPKNEIEQIKKYSYFNMTLWALSLIESFDMSDDELKKSVDIEGEEILTELKQNNEPIILISAHYGNMEILSSYLNRFVTNIYQVARKSNFKQMDDFIVKAREKSGSKIVFRDGAVKKLVKALMKKEVVSLIIDQNINSKAGTEVEFLGKKANQASTAALLSRKFGAKVVPVAIFNKENYKYKIKIYEPIKPIKTSDEQKDLKQLSQLHANAISDIILTDKKQWFWPHKRFKSHYREIYEKNTNNK